jgi:hypothetical protein
MYIIYNLYVYTYDQRIKNIIIYHVYMYILYLRLTRLHASTLTHGLQSTENWLPKAEVLFDRWLEATEDDDFTRLWEWAGSRPSKLRSRNILTGLCLWKMEMFFNNILGLCKARIMGSFINYMKCMITVWKVDSTNEHWNSSSNGDPTNESNKHVAQPTKIWTQAANNIG